MSIKLSPQCTRCNERKKNWNEKPRTGNKIHALFARWLHRSFEYLGAFTWRWQCRGLFPISAFPISFVLPSRILNFLPVHISPSPLSSHLFTSGSCVPHHSFSAYAQYRHQSELGWDPSHFQFQRTYNSAGSFASRRAPAQRSPQSCIVKARIRRCHLRSPRNSQTGTAWSLLLSIPWKREVGRPSSGLERNGPALSTSNVRARVSRNIVRAASSRCARRKYLSFRIKPNRYSPGKFPERRKTMDN